MVTAFIFQPRYLSDETYKKKISHYQNEREAGSESIPQGPLGLIEGTVYERGQAKNTASL